MKGTIKVKIEEFVSVGMELICHAKEVVDEKVSSFYLILFLLLIMIFRGCSSTPQVKVTIENSKENPLIVKSLDKKETMVEYNRYNGFKLVNGKIVIDPQPVIPPNNTNTPPPPPVVKKYKKEYMGFSVGDCVVSKSSYEEFQDDSLEDWEKTSLVFQKITNIGKKNYQYVYYNEDGKKWHDDRRSTSLSQLINYEMVVQCPKVEDR